jgi:hypothetical protein
VLAYRNASDDGGKKWLLALLSNNHANKNAMVCQYLPYGLGIIQGVDNFHLYVVSHAKTAAFCHCEL